MTQDEQTDTAEAVAAERERCLDWFTWYVCERGEPDIRQMTNWIKRGGTVEDFLAETETP